MWQNFICTKSKVWMQKFPIKKRTVSDLLWETKLTRVRDINSTNSALGEDTGSWFMECIFPVYHHKKNFTKMPIWPKICI